MSSTNLAVAPAMSNKNLPIIPEHLKALPQFLVSRFVPNPARGKPDKKPFDAKTGRLAKWSDPATWSTWEQAANAFITCGYDALAFVITENDDLIFLDLDDCAESGQWKPDAQVICQALPCAAWEVSQSGTGLHAIARVSNKADFSERMNKWKDEQGSERECYHRDKIITFGKEGFINAPDIVPLPPEQEKYLLNLAPVRTTEGGGVVDWEQPAPDASLDSGIIAKGFRGDKENNVYHWFGGVTTLFGETLPSSPPESVRPGFIAMWEGDNRLGKFHPPKNNVDAFDRSRVEYILAKELAALTDGNPAWIERLMTQSPLCKRDKWQKNLGNYRQRTIGEAVSSYLADRRRRRIEEDKRIGDDAGFAVVPEIMTLDDALKRLVFVQSGSSVVDRLTKNLLNLTDAERAFAASKHTTETMREIPIIKALWVPHPQRLTVDVPVWSPGDAEFCNALERDQAGNRAYNLWAGLPLLPAPDDWQERVKPFLDHVRYLIPIAVECEQFLNWGAHIFQKPQELPHTHYLMIATEKGTGRGALCSILTRALRGFVASNIDINKTVFGDFNGRLSQKLLATVDEVREGASHNRWAKAESLKSALTSETRHINKKYGLQTVEKNCTRFLMCSNHHDALPFDNGDRRIIVVENPTEKRTKQYFEMLYELMQDDQFIASVQRYLMERDISAYNPFDLPPMNAAKEKALRSLESDTERAVRQFAAEWPGRFATHSDLRRFIGDDSISNSALRHPIERTGMKTGGRLTVGGTKETLLIVRGNIMPEDLRPEMNDTIAAEILAARFQISR